MRRAGHLSLLAGLVLVGGCGADDTPSRAVRTPPGFERAGTSDASVAVPPGWTTSTHAARTGKPGETVTEAVGPKGTDDLAPQAVVGASRHYRSGHAGQLELNALANETRFPELREISRKPVTVAGAQRATLIESETMNRPRVGPATPVRIFDLLAISKDQTAVALFVRAPAADVDRSRIHDILTSLEVK